MKNKSNKFSKSYVAPFCIFVFKEKIKGKQDAATVVFVDVSGNPFQELNSRTSVLKFEGGMPILKQIAESTFAAGKAWIIAAIYGKYLKGFYSNLGQEVPASLQGFSFACEEICTCLTYAQAIKVKNCFVNFIHRHEEEYRADFEEVVEENYDFVQKRISYTDACLNDFAERLRFLTVTRGMENSDLMRALLTPSSASLRNPKYLLPQEPESHERPYINSALEIRGLSMKHANLFAILSAINFTIHNEMNNMDGDRNYTSLSEIYELLHWENSIFEWLLEDLLGRITRGKIDGKAMQNILLRISRAYNLSAELDFEDLM